MPSPRNMRRMLGKKKAKQRRRRRRKREPRQKTPRLPNTLNTIRKAKSKIMAIHIGTLKPPRGSNQRRKRVGLGMGSGHGKTATRGSKGQRSRAGSRMRPGFEGGQMRLRRPLPQTGFTNI